MNRKISLGVTIALMSLAAAVAIVITAGYSMYDFNGRMQSLRESEVMYSKLNEIDGYVRQNFYGDIDEEELMNAVAKGYVSGLGDKYARYMTPEEYQAQMEAYESQKASIGVSVVMDPSGYMKVIEVFADSPAETFSVAAQSVISTKVSSLLQPGDRRITSCASRLSTIQLQHLFFIPHNI